MKESYWAKVLFREFTSHYIEMTREERALDIEKSLVALAKLDASGDSFGAKMVGWANERMEQKAAKASRENGSLGGRPRITPDAPNGNAGDDRKAGTSGTHSGKPASGGGAGAKLLRRPRDRTEFHEFVADNNLHEGLAEEWYEISENRGWTFEDGSPIANWKGALKAYCTKKETRIGR